MDERARERRHGRPAALAAAALTAPLLVLALLALPRADVPMARAAATFTVTTTFEDPLTAQDNAQGDGICATTLAVCTLRAAIQEANAFPGADVIEFNIPGAGPHVISLVSDPTDDDNLPDITEGLTIDGTSEPDFAGTPVVVLDGNLGSEVNGLRLNTQTNGPATIRGLSIINFEGNTGFGNGIWGQSGSGHVIEGNYIGVEPDGVTAAPNQNAGIAFGFAANGSLIGGDTAAERNVISGNTGGAIALATGASVNVISGNYIGLGADGTTAVPNGGGIGISNGSFGNRIGGTAPGEGNVISANAFDGIVIADLVSQSGTIIQGNYIGTDASGTLDRGNGESGIRLYFADNTLIGGTTPAARNVISGNDEHGIEFETADVTTTTVQGNYIGTNAAGTSEIRNGEHGIFINGAENNLIGGIDAGAGNVISGNTQSGIWIETAGPPAIVNRIFGNLIGLDAAGTGTIPNLAYGVANGSNTATIIGGNGPGERNVITGNLSAGVYIFGSGAVRVEGNYIGTSITGGLPTGAIGGAGVDMSNGEGSHVVGGSQPSMRNIISGNGACGVRILFISSKDNRVQNNYIGVGPDGITPLPNQCGIEIASTAESSVIGGGAGLGNLIAHNTNAGVLVDGAFTDEHQIRGNSIHSNGGLGIDLTNGANGGILAPTIATKNTGTACLGCTVDIYSDTGDEGRVYEGSTTANGVTGDWTFSGTVTGPRVTATATEADGSTSEFSTAYNLIITGFAGTAGSPGLSAEGEPAATALLDGPHGLHKDTDGQLYFADTNNDRVRVVGTTAGNPVTTFAGGGTPCAGAIGDGCPADQAILSAPRDVFIDSEGDVYIADTGHCRIRKVSGGIITTVAGNGTCAYGGDGGDATSASLNSPRGVWVDTDAQIYIADTLNDRIRKVNFQGIITTVAGTGTPGDAGDLGAATMAQLDEPHDVFALDRRTLLIADTGNHKIRSVASGIIRTYAGDGTAGETGDGGLATAARLNGPEALTVDADGNVYIADTQNDKIRKVFTPGGTAAPIISLFAGTGDPGNDGEGGAAILAELNKPTGLAVGTVSVSNGEGHNIQQIQAQVEPCGETGCDGRVQSTVKPVTSCSSAVGSAATADLAMLIAPLGLLLGRKRLGRLFALLTRLPLRPQEAR